METLTSILVIAVLFKCVELSPLPLEKEPWTLYLIRFRDIEESIVNNNGVKTDEHLEDLSNLEAMIRTDCEDAIIRVAPGSTPGLSITDLVTNIYVMTAPETGDDYNEAEYSWMLPAVDCKPKTQLTKSEKPSDLEAKRKDFLLQADETSPDFIDVQKIMLENFNKMKQVQTNHSDVNNKKTSSSGNPQIPNNIDSGTEGLLLNPNENTDEFFALQKAMLDNFSDNKRHANPVTLSIGTNSIGQNPSLTDHYYGTGMAQSPHSRPGQTIGSESKPNVAGDRNTKDQGFVVDPEEKDPEFVEAQNSILDYYSKSLQKISQSNPQGTVQSPSRRPESINSSLVPANPETDASGLSYSLHPAGSLTLSEAHQGVTEPLPETPQVPTLSEESDFQDFINSQRARWRQEEQQFQR